MSEASNNAHGHAFKGHAVNLFLAPELCSANQKFMAANDTGPTYTGLLVYVEGLHSLGYLNDDLYAKFKGKYNQKLVPETAPKPLTLAEKKTKDEQTALAREFGSVIAQWELPHNDPQWKEKKIARAEKYKDTIPQAKQLLDMIAKKNIVQEGL